MKMMRLSVLLIASFVCGLILTLTPSAANAAPVGRESIRGKAHALIIYGKAHASVIDLTGTRTGGGGGGFGWGSPPRLRGSAVTR